MRVLLTTSSNPVPILLATKTIIRSSAPTGDHYSLSAITISFDGVHPTADPIEVQLGRVSGTDGTGSTLSETVLHDRVTANIRVVGTFNFTAEPTWGDILRRWFIRPYRFSPFRYVISEPDQFSPDAGGGLALRVVSPDHDVNCIASMEVEE